MQIDPGSAYDVIIAGAGPAGCVLASRLSEDAGRQVLLVEAGPDPAVPGAEHPDVLDPFCLIGSYNSAFHWPGLLALRSAGRIAAERPEPYIQGYGVGGASNINGMGADRGLPADYDAWRDLGAEGWGWRDVLPYFKKLERDLDFRNDMHGDRGPMPVRRLPRAQWAPFASAIGAALERRGFSFLDDYMADFREGFSAVPTNCLLGSPAGRRVSASMAYLTREVRQRPNLSILSHARVDRVHVEGKRACGVFVQVNGVTHLLRADEIISAGGAIHSPALLLRSGIGPREQLARHGIHLAHELRGVGANLQNHPSISTTAYLPPEAAQPAENIAFLQNWLRYSSHRPGCDPLDMHLMAFNKGAWHSLGHRVGLIVVSVLKAYSRGTVALASADPSRMPDVQFNLLSDSRDEERLVGGLRFALELLTDPQVARQRHEIFLPDARIVAGLRRRTAWNAFKARAITTVLDRAPLRRALLARSRVDAAALLADEPPLREFVRKFANVQFHVCGTCRMGRADDPEAVVDGAGRVHGIEGLRVADASIFPTVPRGYTHFIVIMAAEKIADVIKHGASRNQSSAGGAALVERHAPERHRRALDG